MQAGSEVNSYMLYLAFLAPLNLSCFRNEVSYPATYLRVVLAESSWLKHLTPIRGSSRPLAVMHHASLRGLSRQLATAGVSTRETSMSCSGLASRLLATAASPSATTAVPRPTEQLRAVIVGAPGSGKGTHSTAIVRLWPTVQNIVSGNLLRGEMEAQTPLGLEAAEVMRRGGLLPDDIMATLVGLSFSRNHVSHANSPPS